MSTNGDHYSCDLTLGNDRKSNVEITEAFVHACKLHSYYKEPFSSPGRLLFPWLVVTEEREVLITSNAGSRGPGIVTENQTRGEKNDLN